MECICNMFDMVLADSEKDQFTREVTTAILNKETINRKIANILLQGLPESGKSSLLKRLLKKTLSENYSSTGISEKIVTVEIGPHSAHTSACITEDNAWRETDLNDSIVSQLDRLDSCKECSSQETTEYAESHPGMTGKHPRLDLIYQIDESRANQQVLLLEYNVKNVLEKHDYNTMVDLQTKISLHIRDTGGQVEFQESLSLLIFGPSIFIFVMRTDIEILEEITIKYRSATGKNLNEYQSSVSTMDALIQFLTSVSAMQTTKDSVFQVHKPIVFIVGTHIDKLGSKKHSTLMAINKMLHDKISEYKFSHLVCYANSGFKRVLYEVDNTSSDDQQFQNLRSDISRYIKKKSTFNVEYPVSYLLFCLELQSINETILSIEYCKTLANKFSINKEEDFKSLLHFLHFRVGIIQYYDVDGLSDIVIKDPQVLFNNLTELIMNTFLCNAPLAMSQRESFCQKGILEFEIFEYILSDKKDQITPEQFLQFLEHLRIAVPFTDKTGVLKYFIPSVLNHVEKSSSNSVSTSIDPLYITFSLKVYLVCLFLIS